MTQLDFIVFALLGLSALVGFWRGAAVEIVSIVALVAAAVLAIYALPYTAPLGHKVFHSDWLAAACALVRPSSSSTSSCASGARRLRSESAKPSSSGRWTEAWAWRSAWRAG
jgi:hypothetical protein